MSKIQTLFFFPTHQNTVRWCKHDKKHGGIFVPQKNLSIAFLQNVKIFTWNMLLVYFFLVELLPVAMFAEKFNINKMFY